MSPSTPSGGYPARSGSRRPNYAARRMLASAVVITIIVAVGLVGWRVAGGGDGDPSFGTDSWNQLALVDTSTGEITVLTDDGTLIKTLPGNGRVTKTFAQNDRFVLVGTDQIALFTDDDTPALIPIDRGDVVEQLDITSKIVLVVGRKNGGDIRIVDVDTGDVTDIGAQAGQADPLMFLETIVFDTDGTVFAAADASQFQTIVVSPGTDTPTFYPDAPLAISDQIVVTRQVVGQRADIGLYDTSGNNLTIAQADIPVGGVVVGDKLVMVSQGGEVFRVGRGDREPVRLGDPATPPDTSVRWVRPTMDGQRLVVFGDVFETVVALDGSSVFTTTFTSPVDAPMPDPAWACLPVGGGKSFHSLIALDSGDQLADLSGVEVIDTSSNGCTLLAKRAGVTEVISAEGVVALGRLRSAALSPDGRSVVMRGTDGSVDLVTINADLTLDDPIDLDASAPSNLAVLFLDR